MPSCLAAARPRENTEGEYSGLEHEVVEGVGVPDAVEVVDGLPLTEAVGVGEAPADRVAAADSDGLALTDDDGDGLGDSDAGGVEDGAPEADGPAVGEPVADGGGLVVAAGVVVRVAVGDAPLPAATLYSGR